MRKICIVLSLAVCLNCVADEPEKTLPWYQFTTGDWIMVTSAVGSAAWSERYLYPVLPLHEQIPGLDPIEISTSLGVHFTCAGLLFCAGGLGADLAIKGINGAYTCAKFFFDLTKE